MSKASTRDSLLDLLAPVVAESGLDLEDVQITPAGRRRLLRVVVDRDGGVELDAVATVSTAVSSVLDETDAMGGAPYVLEVTSPGVDRPLIEARHWRRATGRMVTATLGDGSTVEGRVARVGHLPLSKGRDVQRLVVGTQEQGRLADRRRPEEREGDAQGSDPKGSPWPHERS